MLKKKKKKKKLSKTRFKNSRDHWSHEILGTIDDNIKFAQRFEFLGRLESKVNHKQMRHVLLILIPTLMEDQRRG
jgi:hypothetical protein